MIEPAYAPNSTLHCTCCSQWRGARNNIQHTGTASANLSSFSISDALHTPSHILLINIAVKGANSATAIGINSLKSNSCRRVKAFDARTASEINAVR